MHTKDALLVHAVQVLMTTRRAFGLQPECHDPRIIMSFFRMCHRVGTVGEIRGIQMRPAATAAAVSTSHLQQVEQGSAQAFGALMRQ